MISRTKQGTDKITPYLEARGFVLVRSSNDHGQDLRFKWYVPCRITAVYIPLLYDVTYVHDGKTKLFIFARLIKYSYSLFDKTVPK